MLFCEQTQRIFTDFHIFNQHFFYHIFWILKALKDVARQVQPVKSHDLRTGLAQRHGRHERQLDPRPSPTTGPPRRP